MDLSHTITGLEDFCNSRQNQSVPTSIIKVIILTVLSCKNLKFGFLFSHQIKRTTIDTHMARVATDLENLEKSGNLNETSQSQGICLKSQGICVKIPKAGNFVV